MLKCNRFFCCLKISVRDLKLELKLFFRIQNESKTIRALERVLSNLFLSIACVTID